ncbi:hypothetical protein Tco_1252954 [Tanacetum coccineum]
MRNSPDICSVDSPICVYEQDRVLNSRLEIQKIRIKGIMGQSAAGHAELWRCWPRQSSAWSASGMQQSWQEMVVVEVAAEVPVRVPDQPCHPLQL